MSTKSKLVGVLRSRKFWAALVAIVFVLLKAFLPDFPLEEEAVLPIVLALVSYIVGTAIENRPYGS